ncbi:hypothetical protein MMC18_007264 [Xylographa bjoerkii]|nr:hypothetical protein [Xylographa bjoerkii]
MSFNLTPDYIFGLLTKAGAGDLGPLLEAVDPEVRWRIGSETQDDVAKTGYFVVGSKAYVEFRGEAIQNNGKPYDNNYLWVMIFDDHGHATEIREYLDTGLVKEVFAEN